MEVASKQNTTSILRVMGESSGAHQFRQPAARLQDCSEPRLTFQLQAVGLLLPVRFGGILSETCSSLPARSLGLFLLPVARARTDRKARERRSTQTAAT